jgi:hypothetical protein
VCTFSCVGRDGKKRDFKYSREEEPLSGKWYFRVTSIPPLPSEEFFELVLEELDANTVRVVSINHFNIPEYTAMGIPEALLPIARSEIGKVVQSSPSRGTSGDVFRSNAATKVWERLVAANAATYDSASDIYELK